MEKIRLYEVIRCESNETEIAFMVRGHKVTGLFPASSKPGLYQQIKHALIGTYVESNLT